MTNTKGTWGKPEAFGGLGPWGEQIYPPNKEHVRCLVYRRLNYFNIHKISIIPEEHLHVSSI